MAALVCSHNRRLGWQLPQWVSLHAIAAALPVEADEVQRRAFGDYVASLQHLLPCSKCQAHLRTLLRDRRCQLASVAGREDARRFVHELHNAVNRSLRKPELDFAEAMRRQDLYQRAVWPALPRDAGAARPSALVYLAVLLFVLVLVLAFSRLLGAGKEPSSLAQHTLSARTEAARPWREPPTD